MAGWIGNHLDTWVLLVPKDDLSAFHVLLAGRCLYLGKKKHIIIISDRDYPRTLLARALGSRDFALETGRLLLDEVSLGQACYHYSKKANFTVSPIPLRDIPKVIVLGNYPEKNFQHWKPIPSKGKEKLYISKKSTLELLLRYHVAEEIFLDEGPLPEGIYWTKDTRTIYLGGKPI